MCLVRHNIYDTIYACHLTNSSTGTLSCVANGTSSCNVVSVQTTGSSFSGTYDAALPPTVSSKRRRRLAETKPGIVNPMICLQKGDSIMFSVTNQSYPVYAKDSLMNTNPAFDYGAFRTLDEKMKSNAVAISAFAFSFVQSGIYVLVLSNNADALTIVTVMDTVHNTGLIFGLYYFRRKSWVGKQVGAGGYKEKARGFNLSNLTSKGSVVKKNAKPIQDDVVPSDDLEAKAKTTNAGEYQPELNRWDDDDLGVRELVDRLQFHHDSVEKAFSDQEAGAVKMMKLLQNEADELKRLLASIVVAQSKEKEPEGCDAELVLVESLEKSAVARAEFEAQQTATEGALVVSARTLAATVQDKGVVSTIIDEMMRGHGTSRLLQAITSELGSLVQTISSTAEPSVGVWPTLQSEQNRRKVDAAVWNAFGKTTRDLLPPKLLELKQSCSRYASECDEKAKEVCDGLLKFSNVAPSYVKKLEAFQEVCAVEIKQALEQQNPALLKPLRQKHEKVLQGLLKELQGGASKLVARVESDQVQLHAIRSKCQPEALHMQKELDALKHDLTLAKAETNPANDVAELLAQLRTLLSNPGQFQLMPPAVVAPTLNLDAIFAESGTMAEPVFEDDSGDMAELQQLMDEGDFSQDEVKVSKMRQEFVSDLDANPSLTDDERQSLLDEFNDDMAQLELSLGLERHKQEEHLRNRLAIRKLNKSKEANALLQDQALEAAMREKQELELIELERVFAEEQAKIEQEFNSKFDGVKKKSSQLLVRGNTGKRMSDVKANDENVAKAVQDEFNAKWNERQQLLDDDARRAKAKLNARKKARSAVQADPTKAADGTAAVLNTLNDIEANQLKRAVEMKNDRLQNQRMADAVKLETATPADTALLQKVGYFELQYRGHSQVLAQVLAENTTKWSDRLQAVVADELQWSHQWSELKPAAMTLELLQMNTKMQLLFQTERDAVKCAQVQEKTLLGSVLTDDDAVLNQMHMDFNVKWNARNQALLDDEQRQKQKLNERRAKRKTKAGALQEDVQEADLLLGLVTERQSLDEIGSTIKAHAFDSLSENDNEDAIAEIQRKFALEWARQKELQAAEATVKRAQLKQRLKRQREDMLPEEKDLVQALEVLETQQVEQEIQIDLDAVASGILADKALLEVLSSHDQQAIDERQNRLNDDAAAARANLNERLKKKRHVVLESVLEADLLAKAEALMTAKLVEKAQLGNVTVGEKQSVQTLLAEHDAKWTTRQKELDELEQKWVQELTNQNASKEELDELELNVNLQRNKIAMNEAKEKAQLVALQAIDFGGLEDCNDSTIQKYARKCKERQALLQDEESRLRNRLQDRLARRKKQDGEPAVTPAEVSQLEAQLQDDMDARRKQVELENLLDKAKIQVLTADDEDTIRRIQEEHLRTSADKQRSLDDEESILKHKLAERLAKKRDKLKQATTPLLADQLILQLEREGDAEMREIENAVDEKRRVLETIDKLVKGWTPTPAPTDNESEIDLINAELAKHTKDRQRMLDEEEQLKKARLQERMDKKRKLREDAKQLSDRPTTADQTAEMNREVGKIEAEMAAKRVELEAAADKERELLASAVQQAKSDVDAMVDKVKRDHQANLETLKLSLDAERAKEELALKERIASRRKQKDKGKMDEAALAAQDAAEKTALAAKLDQDAKDALDKEKLRAEEGNRFHLGHIANKAELQALQAASEKKMAEDEWTRLKDIHEVELKQLQSTLDSEQQRQESKLKDRIRLRREQKERELALCKDQEEVVKARAALEEQERAEKVKLAAQLAKQADEAMHDELLRQEEAKNAAELKLNQAAIESAAAAAAMDAFRASELDRVSMEYSNKMNQLHQDTANEAQTQKAKLEARMAAKKNKKAMELQAKKDKEKEALLEKQRAEANALQARLADAERLAQVDAILHEQAKQTPRVEETAEGNAMTAAHEAEQKELDAKQAMEVKRLEAEALNEKVNTGRRLDDDKLSASQEQLQVKQELDRVTTEFQEKLTAHTDSLHQESSQKKKDLMRRLEEKKKKKKDELMAQQAVERAAAVQAQKSDQEKLANKLEMEREVAMIQKLLAQNSIVVSQLTPIIERVVEKRHKREQSLLFAKQYRERAAVLRDALQTLMQQKAKEKTSLVESTTDVADRDRQLDELEAMYRVKQQDIEASGTHDVEAAQTKEQASLKERHVADVAYLYQQFVGQCKPDVVVVAPVTTATTTTVAAVDDGTAGLRGQLELEKQARIDSILQAGATAMQKLRDGLAAEWNELDEAYIAQLAVERQDGDREWHVQKQKVMAQPVSEKRRTALVAALEVERKKQEAALASMLKARFQHKKERKERVCKRRLKRTDDDTKRRVEIVHAQFLVSLADELESRKHKDEMVKTPSLALLGLGKERLQGAMNRTKTLVRLGSVADTTSRTDDDHDVQASTSLLSSITLAHVNESHPQQPPHHPMELIGQKLDSIERLIRRLTSSERPVTLPAGPNSIKSALLSAYPGLEQDAKASTGALKPLDASMLTKRQFARLEFGQKLVSTLDPTLQIAVASVLTPSPGVFGHSMTYEPKSHTLYVRQSRLESVPELSLLLVHSDFFAKSDDLGLVPAASMESLVALGRSKDAVGMTPASYFLPGQIESRLADMQAFLDQMQNDAAEGDDHVTLLDHQSTSKLLLPSSKPTQSPQSIRKERTTSPRSFKKIGSSRALFMANAEQQVTSLQVGDVEHDKDVTLEASDAVELLEDALSEAEAEHVEHEVGLLSKKLSEAKEDLARVKADRDDVARRCEKLRLEIKAKVDAV
ncbi:hypothetical protein DYB37_005369 [Aphanomyces astaci]|uniref:Uncharacterized protein n=1 Tax=Aphanomyces astaci TaxID=112090 RepID=A0A3R7BEF3_APHAT|nr:hypothetical protein DYB37_005369 [Aphanomyces astaci]